MNIYHITFFIGTSQHLRNMSVLTLIFYIKIDGVMYYNDKVLTVNI